MFVSNRNSLQNIANGVCPAPDTTPVQTAIVVQDNSANCQSQACPAPTREGIAIDTSKLFTEECGEITLEVENTGNQTSEVIIGRNSIEGWYAINCTSPSAADNPAMRSINSCYPDAANGNVPEVQYVSQLASFTPLILSGITIDNIGSSAQQAQKLKVVQQGFDVQDLCSKSIKASLCQPCFNNNNTDLLMAQFTGTFAIDSQNSVSYPVLPGEAVEIRLCVAGEAKIRDFAPCE